MSLASTRPRPRRRRHWSLRRHRCRHRPRARQARATSWCWWPARPTSSRLSPTRSRPPRTSYRSTSATVRHARSARGARVARPGPADPGQQRGFSTTGPVHASDPEREAALVEVDVLAVVDLAAGSCPAWSSGPGAVLNVASTAAFQPLPGQAAYGAAKAFVLSYTRSLAGELKGTGVSVTALCPGPVDTGFGEAAGFCKYEAGTRCPPSSGWNRPRSPSRPSQASTRAAWSSSPASATSWAPGSPPSLPSGCSSRSWRGTTRRCGAEVSSWNDGS